MFFEELCWIYTKSKGLREANIMYQDRMRTLRKTEYWKKSGERDGNRNDESCKFTFYQQTVAKFMQAHLPAPKNEISHSPRQRNTVRKRKCACVESGRNKKRFKDFFVLKVSNYANLPTSAGIGKHH